MKAKFNFNFKIEFVTVWLGAIVTALILVGTVIFVSQESAERFKQRHLNDPRLNEVELRVPSFEKKPMGAEEVNAALADGAEDSASGKRLTASASSTPEVRWSYAGATGPDFWAQLTDAYADCGTKDQSPVDLPTTADRDRDLQPVRFLYKNLPGQLYVDRPVMTFKPVQGHSAVLFDETFYLQHMEFHVPSEHQLNGVGYDMEVQFYHRNIADQWAVVSVLLSESRQSHPELKKLIASIPKIRNRPADLGSFQPAEFLPEGSTYLHYTGSFTSPPCSPGVRWLVMTSPVAVSDAQIDALSKAMGFTARPLQELGGKSVGKSWR